MLVMTATAFAETTSEKLVEDNYALAGKVLSPKAVTVNWDTQKLVAVLDMTTCSDTENERVFSVSNNETDVANWEQKNGGSTVHLFYTKNAQVWTGTAMELYHQKFAVQYRYQGDASATSHYKEVTDPSTVTVVMARQVSASMVNLCSQLLKCPTSTVRARTNSTSAQVAALLVTLPISQWSL